jgi:hypothetical protein
MNGDERRRAAAFDVQLTDAVAGGLRRSS